MGDKTKIEWTDATWNPVTGCTKVSAGCKNCYAERDFHRPYPGRAFTDVRTHPDRLDQPLRWRKPKRIFVNSMSDLFHEAVPDSFIDSVFIRMAIAQQHTFQILTKRPQRMLEWIPKMLWNVDGLANSLNYLPNVWLGVSVENQEAADERIPLLLQTPAAVRWVSYEPALGPVDFRCIQTDMVEIDALTGDHGVYRPLAGRSECKLNWVVAGGESGPGARPAHPDWFRKVRDDCRAAGVSFFFKQWGEWTAEERPGTEVDLLTLKPNECVAWGNGKNTHTLYTRVGKKRTGRLLDGREWSEFPEINRKGPEAQHAGIEPSASPHLRGEACS
jgi:protein gp37